MRPLPLVAAGGISVAVLTAVVTFLWTLGSGAAERTPFSTVDLVPRDVDFYLAVNTEPSSSQWIAFAGTLSKLKLEDPVRDAWNELLLEEDVRWDEDVVSLLGDEGYIAITDFGALEDGRGAVGAFRLRDEGKAEELFLRLARPAAEDEGVELLDEEYRGEKVYYVEETDPDNGSFFDEDESDLTGALAFTDGVAVVGLTREDVHGVVDVVQGRAPTIAENPRAEELRAAQVARGEDFLLWGYADMAAAWDALEEYLAESEDGDQPFDTERVLADARANVDRVTFTVSARHDGFVADATVLRAPDAPAERDYAFDTVFDSHFADQVPADTMAFVAGYDLYHQAYVPLRDSLADLDLSFTDPYCGGEFSYFYPGEFAEEDDPVYGQFYDQYGEFDEEAYEEWQANLERFFTGPDGSTDYDALYDYIDGIYEQYCEEQSQTLEEAIAEFEQDVGFDLEDDLLGLFTGEAAFAFDARDFNADEPEFEALGLFDVTDAARVEESMRLLGQYAEREEGGRLSGPDDAGVYRFQNEADPDNVVAWAVTDGSLAVSYPAAPAAAFVEGLDGGSLAENADWQRLMELLPEQKTSVAYVSLARILEEVRAVDDAEAEFEDFTDGEVTLDDLEPVRSLGIATTNVEGGWAVRLAVLID